MSGATKTERDRLFQEIFDVLSQWPELERKIFSLAHYHGQSAEVISQSAQLDPKTVESILKQCERHLHASLRDFRESAAYSSLPLREMKRSPAFKANPLCSRQCVSL